MSWQMSWREIVEIFGPSSGVFLTLPIIGLILYLFGSLYLYKASIAGAAFSMSLLGIASLAATILVVLLDSTTSDSRFLQIIRASLLYISFWPLLASAVVNYRRIGRVVHFSASRTAFCALVPIILHWVMWILASSEFEVR